MPMQVLSLHFVGLECVCPKPMLSPYGFDRLPPHPKESTKAVSALQKRGAGVRHQLAWGRAGQWREVWLVPAERLQCCLLLGFLLLILAQGQ